MSHEDQPGYSCVSAQAPPTVSSSTSLPLQGNSLSAVLLWTAAGPVQLVLHPLSPSQENDSIIEVTVNRHFVDGAYAGNQTSRVTQRQVTPATRPREPVRRVPFTELINFRANRTPVKLEELTKSQTPTTVFSHTLHGHNRWVSLTLHHCIILEGQIS